MTLQMLFLLLAAIAGHAKNFDAEYCCFGDFLKQR